MKKSKIKERFRRGIAIALAVVFGFSGLSTSNVLADDVDRDIPVIESVEMIPSANQLTTNDSVTIRLTAYDAQSGISSAYANVYYYDENGVTNADAQGVSLHATDTENVYEGTVELINYRGGGTLALSYLDVRDLQNNSANGYEFIYNDANNHMNTLDNMKTKVSFTKADAGTTDIRVSSIGIYKDGSCTESLEGQTIEATGTTNAYFYMKMVVSDETNVDSFYARFDGDAGTVINDVKFYKSYDSYTGSSYISSYKLGSMTEETFRLTHVFAKMTDGSVVEVTPADGTDYSAKWFKFKKNTSNEHAGETPAYESIVFKVDGKELKPDQMVYPGKTVDIEVTIKADKAYEDTINATFSVALKDNSSSNWVVLTRTSADSNVYTGKFEVTDDTYPTVWVLRGLGWASDRSVSWTMSDYYFVVQHGEGGTVVLPTFDSYFMVDYLTESDGHLVKKSDSIYLKDLQMFSHVTKDQLNITNVPTSVGGMNIIGWHVYKHVGNGIDYTLKDMGALEDYQITSDTAQLYVRPVYDKKLVTVHYDYVKDGKLCTDDVNYTYGQDETITDETFNSYLAKECPAEAGATFEKWNTYSSADTVNDLIAKYGTADIYATARYTGKDIIVANYDRGSLEYDPYEEAALVDEGLTDDQLIEMFKNPKKNPFDGVDLNGAVKVKSWEAHGVVEEDENERYVYYYAECDNCVAQFVISSDTETGFYYMGFNEGDTFTLPSEMGDFKDIKWTEEGSWAGSGKDTYKKIDGSETFTAVKTMMFTGTGTYTGKHTESNGSVAGSDSTGSDSSSSGSTAAPAATYVPVTMPAEKISAQVTAITSAVSAGQKTIKVPMDGATVVPVAILEAAKGKDIDVVLDMGGYSWTINGKDIKASNLKDIDLKVNFDTNAIPSSLVSSLAGSNPTKQISLAYNGDFGFKANLSFNIGSEYQGKYGNLYYYDSNGKLVFMNAGKITSDGTVSLEFSHASDYVIVISEASMAPVAPKTGDDTALFVWFVLLFAGVTLLTAVYRKRAAR